MQKVSVLSVVLAGRLVIELQGMCTEDSDIMGTVLAQTDLLHGKCKNAQPVVRGSTYTLLL